MGFPFYGQGVGFDGYIMLAILTLFFVYYLPSLIRSAQVVAEVRVEDRFSTDMHIVATAGNQPQKPVSQGRAYIHPQRKMEQPMNTPVAGNLAADARRVAAARAARAAAASRRAAAAKRRLVLLGVLGALTVVGWILTATVGFTWIIPAALTALTVGVGELGRRAAAAGLKADHKLAEQVRKAETQAGIRRPRPQPVEHNAQREGNNPIDLVEATTSQDSHTGQEPASSLRVDVDPASAQDDSWTPVPVPPPAYTLKATVRRKMVEPYQPEQTQASHNADHDTGDDHHELAENPVDEVEQSETPEPVATAGHDDHENPGGMNVQEILARRRAVG